MIEKDENHRYWFEVYDRNVEDIFVKFINSNKTTVSKFINLAILMALAVSPKLTKDERHLLKGALPRTKLWCNS